MLSDAVQALLQIFNIEFVLNGYPMTLGELILFFAFGGVICFIVGGMLK